MSDNILHPDDPRLTAYALGELSPSERTEVERLLEGSPGARVAIDQIRELAVTLAGELHEEATALLTSEQREAIVHAGTAAESDMKPSRLHESPAKAAPSRWRARFATLSTVAAMIAVALMLSNFGKSNIPDERGVARNVSGDGSEEISFQLAAQIEKYQELYDQKRYDEALVLAKKTKEIAPESPVAQVMELKARFAIREELDGDRLLDGKEKSAVSVDQLNDLNVAASSSPAELSYGDVKRWQELSRRRSFVQGVANQPVTTKPADSSLVMSGDQGKSSESKNHYFAFDGYHPARQSGGGQSSASTIGSGKEAKPVSGRSDFGAQLSQSGDANQNKGGAAGKPMSGYSEGGKDPRSLGFREGQKGSGEKSGGKGEAREAAPGLQAGDDSRSTGAVAGNGTVKAPFGAPGTTVTRVEDEMQMLPKGVKRGAGGGGIASYMVRAKNGQPGAADAPEDSTKSGLTFSKLRKDSGAVPYGEGEVAEQGRKIVGEAKDETVALNESGYRRLRTIVLHDGTVRYVPETEGVSRSTWERAPASDFLYTATPGTEQYEPIYENHFVSPRTEPLSTFGVDVDTASYANTRRFLRQGQWPPRNAVRVEEFVNYFSYDYPQPTGDRPFSVNVEVGKCPWQPEHRLVRIGLKGKEIPKDKRPASNLVFLVDVSGSMADQNKLPLVKNGLQLLTEQMTEGDRVAIVTYSDTAQVRLESTTGDKQQVIRDVINSLNAGGSTNGAAGIQMAYDSAARHYLENGTNRVILCTDGDFNVGVTGDDELVKMIQERAKTRVFFSVFGFGMGNLKDGKLEKLADKGNGHYAYVDDDREARKVFVEELASNLITIAKDVKIQVEFNPATVGAYRLIGYENRAMPAQDFQDDKKDAGEIGAGHTVTALYEVLPADKVVAEAPNKALRYQTVLVPKNGETAGEMLTVKLRYKQPEGDTSTLVEVPVKDMTAPSKPSPDFEWASAVAGFAMILRTSEYRGQAGLNLVQELAQGAKGEDKSGRRAEFIDLINRAKSIHPELAQSPKSALREPGEPAPVLTRDQAQQKATVNGKYRNLLRVLEVPADAASYGEFREYGSWSGTSYAGQSNLPAGYWVYVAPHWYIWGDTAAEERK